MRRSIYRFVCNVLIVCLLMPGMTLSSQEAHAADDAEFLTFLYDTFPNGDTRIRYNENAAPDGGKMRLTTSSSGLDGNGVMGSVFNNDRVSLKDDRSFSTYFTFQISQSVAYNGGPRGGDGITFTVQTDDNTKAARGGSLGYFGINQSVAVKFDTWQNGEHQDPSDNSIGILQNGVVNTPLKIVAVDKSTLDLMTGTIHAWIDYNGPTGTIEVRVNKNSDERPDDPILSHTFPPEQRLTQILNSDLAYVGFTASTGGSRQKHEITKWYFSNYYLPIDVKNNTYKQAPSSYTLSTNDLGDGRTKLSIQAVGDNIDSVPLTVSVADEHAVVTPSTVTTNATGEAEVVLSSSDNRLIVSTVTVEGPGGVNASTNVTIPGRTAAPLAANITANATTKTVSVKGVPSGATVTLYNDQDIVLGTETNVTSGSASFGVLGLSVDDQIKVSFRVPPQLESAKTSSTAKESSAPLNIADVDVNVVTDTVTVGNVPKDATITVYDDEGNVLKQITNPGPGAAQVELDELGLEAGKDISVTITENGKFESDPITITVTKPTLALSTDTLPDGTLDLTIQAAGNHASGIPLTVTLGNNGAVATPSSVTTDTYGKATAILSSSDHSTITTTVTASGPGGVTATETVTIPGRTAAPQASNVDANALTDKVIVTGVPAGATVRLYDDEDNLLRTESNVTNGSATFAGLVLSVDQPIKVTFHLAPQLESTKTVVTPYVTTSGSPSSADITEIDVASGTIKIDNVPPGAVVTIYTPDDQIIGQGTNNGATPGEVTIVVNDIPLRHEEIKITIKEPDKQESNPLTINVEQITLDKIDEAIKALEVEYQPGDTWESVTLPIFVASVGLNNTSVYWTSSQPRVVEITEPVNHRIEAIVRRQDKDVSVILTAEVSKNGKKRTRTFLVIVKADGLVKTIDAGQRTVDVTGGSNGQVTKQLDIDRIILTNGTDTVKIDKTIFDVAKADEFINEPGTTGSVSRIYVDTFASDEADEYAIEVPEDTLARLFGNGNSLEVNTDYGSVSITNSVLGDMVDNFLDLYFRIVPVKDYVQQSEINSKIVNDPDVWTTVGNRGIQVLGSSLEVETNYTNYNTTLFLAFAKNGITVPTEDVDRFLNSLRVYIEHSNGETSFEPGEVVYDGAGNPIGLSIRISKFSTFSIVQVIDYNVPVVIIGEQGIKEERMVGYHPAYINGFSDGTFRPNQAITRAEMAALISRNLTQSAIEAYQQLFPDVSSSHWAAAYIEQLHRAGLVVGDQQGRFNPGALMTRAELATIVAKWMKLEIEQVNEPPFPDIAVSHWAAGAIAAAHKAGFIVGFPDGNFDANKPVTRAEAVTTLNRLLGRSELAGVDQPTWRDVPMNHWAFKAIEEASHTHYYLVNSEGIEEPVEAEETVK